MEVNKVQKIGVLYICTGPYYLFWEDFYKSFEENGKTHEIINVRDLVSLDNTLYILTYTN